MVQKNHNKSAGEPSLDACLELLANRQRRVVLEFFLASETDSAPFDELVAEIIDDEAERTGERPGHDTIAATLFHVHLPKFADADILDIDARHLDVHYTGAPRLEEVYEKIKDL